jgi:hypothetical protein
MSELEREIERAKAEIDGIEKSLMEKRGYLSGLEKALKYQTKQAPGPSSLRPGSDAHKALLALKSAGSPLHVDALLKVMEKEPTQQNKTSLTGSLAAYVRKKSVFTRPAPNTFGLVEFESESQDSDIFG